jgi:hypothetical protein
VHPEPHECHEDGKGDGEGNEEDWHEEPPEEADLDQRLAEGDSLVVVGVDHLEREEWSLDRRPGEGGRGDSEQTVGK